LSGLFIFALPFSAQLGWGSVEPHIDGAQGGLASLPGAQEASSALIDLPRGGLALQTSEPSEGYAAALGLAMAGRFDEAGLHLERLAARREDPLHARVLREAERVELYRKERRAFLEHLRASGRKLNLRKSALGLLATVEEVRESEVVLGKNRAKINVLTLDDIDGVALSEAMWSSDFPAGAISVYPLVLRGEGGKKAMLRDGSREAERLLEDLESGFDGHAERAAAARLLGELARTPVPVPPDRVDGVLKRLGELARAHARVDLVRARLSLLKAMARELLEVRFEREGLGELLKGDCQALGDGRVRLSYGFDAPEELGDFVVKDYLREHAFAEVGPWSIEDKHLKVKGLLSMRHVLDFEGEVRIHATWLYPEQVSRRWQLWLGVRDDGEGHFVAARPDGGLLAIDGPGDAVRNVDGEFRWRYDKLYTLEAHYDGERRALCTIDGEARKSLAVEPRPSGGVFLFVCSQMRFQLHGIVIEGRPGGAATSRLRAEWMARELGALGL